MGWKHTEGYGLGDNDAPFRSFGLKEACHVEITRQLPNQIITFIYPHLKRNNIYIYIPTLKECVCVSM